MKRTSGPENENNSERGVFKDTKDPLVSGGVAVQTFGTLGDTDDEADQEQTDRNENLSEKGVGERVLELGLGGDETSGATLDDEHKRAENNDRDGLEDVAREIDEGGSLCQRVPWCTYSDRKHGLGAGQVGSLG